MHKVSVFHAPRLKKADKNPGQALEMRQPGAIHACSDDSTYCIAAEIARGEGGGGHSQRMDHVPGQEKGPPGRFHG